MAIADKGSIGSSANATNLSSYSWGTTTTTVDIGDICIVVSSTDNTSTTNGDNSEMASVTDNAGNTYTKLAEYTNSPGGVAADGVTVSVWMTKATGQMLAGFGSITMNYNGARADKCVFGRVFTISGATLAQSATAVGNAVTAANGFGSASFAGLPSIERLYLRAMAKESNSTTGITVSSGFTAIGSIRSSSLSTAVLARGEYRVNTSTGETSNPTLAVAADAASVFIALEEVTNPVISPGTAALAFTGKAPLLVGAAGAVSVPTGALTLTGPAPTWFTTSTASVPVPPPAALTFTGLAPTVLIGAGIVIGVPAGTLRFKGPASTSPAISPPTAVLRFTGQTPLLVYSLQSVPQAVLTLTGYPPTVLVKPPGTFNIPTGRLTLTGQYVGQGFGLIMPDALVFQGYAPTVKIGTGKVPDPAALVFTGLAPIALVSNVVSPGPAQLVLTGQAPSALTFGMMAPGTASLSLAGQIPQVVIGAVTSPVFTPDTARLGLTGLVPQALSNQAIAVPTGSLVLTGRLPVCDVVGQAQVIQVPTGSLTFASGGSTGPVLNYFYVISPPTARMRLLGPNPSMEGVQFGSGRMNYPSWQAVINT